MPRSRKRKSRKRGRRKKGRSKKYYKIKRGGIRL